MEGSVLSSAAAFLLGTYDHLEGIGHRERHRRWRGKDLAYKHERGAYWDEELLFSVAERDWRAEDYDLRDVRNIDFLWAEFVERTRTEVRQKSEQLKGLAFLSAILAGFALVSFIKFGYDVQAVPLWVNWAYGLTTALACGLALMAMVLSTLVQASILKLHSRYTSAGEEAVFFQRCFRFCERYAPGMAPPRPGKNFNLFWTHRCSHAFVRICVLFIAAVPCLVANLAVAAWIAFPPSDGGGEGGFGLAPALAVDVALALGLLALAGINWRYVWHVLGARWARGAREDGGQPVARGMPWDWHLVAPVSGWERRGAPLHTQAGRAASAAQPLAPGVPPARPNDANTAPAASAAASAAAAATAGVGCRGGGGGCSWDKSSTAAASVCDERGRGGGGHAHALKPG